MKAEIISIGSELVSGQALDTNSQWLSSRLAELGITVHFHSTVGDDLEENLDVFRSAVRRTELVLITGGLGPTQDDLTRDVLAELAGVELEFHEPSYKHIKQLFAQRQREMPERNRVQALFPKGSQPLDNPQGTAPGVWMTLPLEKELHTVPLCTVFAMPGVPSEMKIMFKNEVSPRIKQLPGYSSNEAFVLHRRIHCFGLGESTLEEKLFDLTRRGNIPEVGITVSQATITLRICARGSSPDACHAIIEPTVRTIYDRLGNTVFGEEGTQLQHAMMDLLSRSNQTLSTIEIATGGMLAQSINDVTDSPALYLGGLVTKTEKDALNLLEITDTNGSSRTSEDTGSLTRLAQNCRERFNSQIGLAVGALTESEGTDSVPCVSIAVSVPNHAPLIEKHNVGGDPSILSSRMTKLAINMVRQYLISDDTGSRTG